MASIIGAAKSVIAGRDRIGLTGIYKGSETTIDIDLVSNFINSHNATVSSHPVEKDKNNETLNSIVDHVVITNPTIKITCLISNNLTGLTSKKKLETILAWQSLGTLIKLEGYTTGGGVVSRLVNTLSRGWGSAFDSKIEDPHYVGIDTDVIFNLILGNISITRKSELGEDIELQIDLTRIQFATAQSVDKSKQSKRSAKAGGKGNTPAAKTDANKPIHKSMAKK